MTTMITEVYDALVSAGAEDGKARRAAEVLADYDGKFAGLERRIDLFESNLNPRFAAIVNRIDVFESKVDRRFVALEAKFDGKFNLLYWMLGILIAAVIAIIIRLFV